MENEVNGKLIINNVSIIDDERCGTISKWLYFYDEYFVHLDDEGVCGDLGYEATKADTRNSNSLEENIDDLRYGAKCTLKEDWDDYENEVIVWEIHKALFEIDFRVSEDELDGYDNSLEEYLNDNEWTDWYGNMVDDTDEVVYTMVVSKDAKLSEKTRKTINEYNPIINEIVSMKDID